MRTKLFLAFIFVILLALLSNIFFEKMIMEDFNDYVRGTEEDRIYWIMASVEGSYRSEGWDTQLLGDALHWSLMLGFDSYVEDSSGNKILSSERIYSYMSQGMLKRMNSLLKLPTGIGEFIWYPLFVEGEEIGKLYVRPLERLGLTPVREEIFRDRGREFLVFSFLIAGGGALLLSILFAMFISNPIRRLTRSAEKIAKGDYSVQEPKVQKRLKDEIDRLAETFNYMADALKREDSLRKHLTSNIAHELRTPLTIIRGNLEAIEDGIISDPEKVMKTIKSEIQRIITLVEGIEDITRAEASFFKRGNIEEINLLEFVESVAGGMRKIIEDKNLYLKTVGPSLLVKTYPEKLHIILKNLITNAYKYTRKGGIRIHWGENQHESESGLYISVEDTGRGIDERERSKIFDRFYKGEHSGGQGLGLAIVKELTEVIGGRISVESVPGKGAKFTLFL